MIGYGLMWIGISAAVTSAVIVTHNPHCLWALLIGTLVGFTTRSGGCKKDEED
jgi:hypothetical protein